MVSIDISSLPEVTSSDTGARRPANLPGAVSFSAEAGPPGPSFPFAAATSNVGIGNQRPL